MSQWIYLIIVIILLILGWPILGIIIVECLFKIMDAYNQYMDWLFKCLWKFRKK